MQPSPGSDHEVVAHALSGAGVEEICCVDQRHFEPAVRQLPHMQLQVQRRSASQDLRSGDASQAVQSGASAICVIAQTALSASDRNKPRSHDGLCIPCQQVTFELHQLYQQCVADVGSGRWSQGGERG